MSARNKGSSPPPKKGAPQAPSKSVPTSPSSALFQKKVVGSSSVHNVPRPVPKPGKVEHGMKDGQFSTFPTPQTSTEGTPIPSRTTSPQTKESPPEKAPAPKKPGGSSD